MNGIQKTIAAAAAFAAAAAPIAAEAHDHHRNGGWGRPPVQQFYVQPAPRQHHRHGMDPGVAGALGFLGGLITGGAINGNGGLGGFGGPQYVQPDPGYQPPPPTCTYRGQHECFDPRTGYLIR